jgi:hypothetical protein
VIDEAIPSRGRYPQVVLDAHFVMAQLPTVKGSPSLFSVSYHLPIDHGRRFFLKDGLAICRFTAGRRA